MFIKACRFNFKMAIQYPLILSLVVVAISPLFMVTVPALLYSNHYISVIAAIWMALLACGLNSLMGKSLFGKNAAMYQTLPISEKTSVTSRALIYGLWFGTFLSLLLLFAGEMWGMNFYEVMLELSGTEASTKTELIYAIFTVLPGAIFYVIRSKYSILDSIISQWVSDGDSVLEVATTMTLVPVILFLAGCLLSLLVMFLQIQIKRAEQKVPTELITLMGIGLFTAFGGILIYLGKQIMGSVISPLFYILIVLLTVLLLTAFLYSRCIKSMERGYDL